MNDVPLKEHIESQLEGMREAQRVALAALDRRLEGMNEFRETLRDQASRFVTRLDLEARDNRISALERDKARSEGRASIIAGIVAALVSVAVGVVLSKVSFP